jgi:hypothetical protein
VKSEIWDERRICSPFFLGIRVSLNDCFSSSKNDAWHGSDFLHPLSPTLDSFESTRSVDRGCHGVFLKTIFATDFMARRKGYIKRPQCCLEWVNESNLAKLPDSSIDAISSATQKPGPVELRWDCTDAKGLQSRQLCILIKLRVTFLGITASSGWVRSKFAALHQLLSQYPPTFLT